MWKKIDDMNMITIELQNNTKEWNNIINNLQNQIPYMSTPNIVHLYKNKDHIHVNCNPQHLEYNVYQ